MNIQHQHQGQVRPTKFVTADEVAQRYACTGRYILQLAAQGKIPAVRLGKKCIRFDIDAVAAKLEGGED